MGNARFSDDFKRDAVHPLSGSGLLVNHEKKITVRGYPVAEVSQRLSVSTPSLYIWVKKFSKAPDVETKDEQATENRRLKRELARVTEERDILKKATVYFARDAK